MNFHGADRVKDYYQSICHVMAHLFYFWPNLGVFGHTRNQRKTGHNRKNECHESAFFHSAVRASRTAFEIVAFLAETTQTFESRRE